VFALDFIGGTFFLLSLSAVLLDWIRLVERFRLAAASQLVCILIHRPDWYGALRNPCTINFSTPPDGDCSLSPLFFPLTRSQISIATRSVPATSHIFPVPLVFMQERPLFFFSFPRILSMTPEASEFHAARWHKLEPKTSPSVRKCLPFPTLQLRRAVRRLLIGISPSRDSLSVLTFLCVSPERNAWSMKVIF